MNEFVTSQQNSEPDLKRVAKCLLDFGADSRKNIALITQTLGEIFGAEAVFYLKKEKETLISLAGWHVPEEFTLSDKGPGQALFDLALVKAEGPLLIYDFPGSLYADSDSLVKKYRLQTYIGFQINPDTDKAATLCAVFSRFFKPSTYQVLFLQILGKAASIEDERNRSHLEMESAYKRLRETQAQLVQAEKMEVVGRIASGVAHEVKNPLGIIVQSVNYLEGKIPIQQKNLYDVFQLIKSNVKRADGIIRLLLDFARISELNLKSEELNPTVENAFSAIEPRIVYHQIQVEKEFASGLPRVIIDREKIEQVLINLFLNAIEAMPDDGRLIIRTYRVTLDKYKPGVGRRVLDSFALNEEAAVIEIEDTGGGIPEANLGKVFEPFFTTKAAEKGTGLGLAVSKNILDMHKAMIEIWSVPSKGTKVTLTLKIEKGE